MRKGGKQQGLVLSGGGAYGAYTVGVLKALLAGRSPATDFHPLDPSVICGTSAGTFNASLLLSTYGDLEAGLEHLESVWLNEVANTPESCGNGVFRLRGNPLTLLEQGCLEQGAVAVLQQLFDDGALLAEEWLKRLLSFFDGNADLAQRILELVDLEVFSSAAPLVALVKRRICLDSIRQSERVFLVAATNWRTGALQLFERKHMTEEVGHLIVLASTAIPGVFPSVEIDGEPYVDGGLVMNTPLSPAIHAGADELHVIYADPDVEKIPLARLRSTTGTFYRLIVIGFAAMMNRDIEVAGQINEGLRLLADPSAASTGQAGSVVSLVGGLKKRPEELGSYRPLTIHRYHPRDDPGGVFRWLGFEREHLHRLIGQGFSDTVQHDCRRNRCILTEAFDNRQRPEFRNACVNSSNQPSASQGLRCSLRSGS